MFRQNMDLNNLTITVPLQQNNQDKPSARARSRRDQKLAASTSSFSTTIQTKLIDSFFTTALWITGFAGFWFCEGRAYRDAYLIVYGFDPTTLPWERDNLIYFGLGVGFVDVYAGVYYVAISGFIALLLVIASQRASDHVVSRFRGTRRTARHKPTPGHIATDAQLFAQRVIFLFIGALIFGICGLAMFGFAENHGKNRAKEELLSLSSCDTIALEKARLNAVHIVRLIGNEQVTYDGVLITCSSANCGIRSMTEDAAQLVGRDHILRFETRPAAKACSARHADNKIPG